MVKQPTITETIRLNMLVWTCTENGNVRPVTGLEDLEGE
jgi:hypothetical protein